MLKNTDLTAQNARSRPTLTTMLARWNGQPQEVGSASVFGDDRTLRLLTSSTIGTSARQPHTAQMGYQSFARRMHANTNECQVPLPPWKCLTSSLIYFMLCQTFLTLLLIESLLFFLTTWSLVMGCFIVMSKICERAPLFPIHLRSFGPSASFTPVSATHGSCAS